MVPESVALREASQLLPSLSNNICEQVARSQAAVKLLPPKPRNVFEKRFRISRGHDEPESSPEREREK